MSRKRWVVREDAPRDSRVLRAALEALSEGGAVLEGRAFVNGVRASNESAALAVGDIVEVWAARASSASDSAAILAFRDGFLIADKPAALATTPDHRGARSLVTEVDAWLSVNGASGEGAAHPMSRLDVGVSGAVLFALTRDARRIIEGASDDRRFMKRYIGIAHGRLTGEGILEGAIGRGRRGSKSQPQIREDGRSAQSRFRVLGHAKDATLVELWPLTGRTHQLRLHLADADAPLFGDRAHGGPARVTFASGAVRELDRIMLHAASVTLSSEACARLHVRAPIPAAMTELWSLLDGDPSAWNAPERQR